MISRTFALLCRRDTSVFSPSRRTLSTVTETFSPSISSSQIPVTYQKSTLKPKLLTSIILNRAPILTPTPTPFERAYYAYQARLRRALSNPFPYDFYFKQGSILETRFTLEERKRERIAFGREFGVADDLDKEKAAANRAAVEQLAEQEGESEEMMSRVHPSDEARDYKSLDRKAKRNLYLLLQENVGTWRFPQGNLTRGVLLHQAAQKGLLTECGEYMDTWIVSRNPIGHYRPPRKVPSQPEEVAFFYKAHILAGQARPNPETVKDFAWVTKQEVEIRVPEYYWNGVKDMLSDH
ncbi:39S mitochondrial ribosomal protein L46-domain-containing protein [Lentinula aciculospora]|uniref:Large ribosomal subunit protein mL46 n=1 Tax=Lentinula aciculospora TaxID=153920 RepID=A0A9W9ASF9_9AGAR|nr:39S mitochondrial ribosomal protein L46-domain-containing protein [Lentinula aciculospora]